MTPVPASGNDSREGGFALALVVLLLFAIAVAAATGYQVVRTEARLALQTHEGVQSLAIARAGLQRFIAEELGEPSDTVVYVVNGGEALVTSRKLYDMTIPDELYLVTSVGTYADPQGQTAPATRTVRQHVVRRGSPLNRLAGFIALSGNVRVDAGATVDGTDQADLTHCADAGEGGDIGGIAAVGNINVQGTVDGNPPTSQYADSAALATALDLPWAALRDPDFPVGEFDNAPASWPNFAFLPPDSFPLVRVNGDFNASGVSTGCTTSFPIPARCRGVLIVTGSFSPSYSFTWDGIILAADFDPPTGNANQPAGLAQNRFTINGILAVGLDGAIQGQLRIREPGEIRYNFCWALESGRALAHLDPVDGTWYEAM